MASSTLGNIFSVFGRFGGFSNGQTNRNYYTLQGIGDTTPTLINTSNKWDLYNDIPELQAVINRKAKMIASANPIVCDKDGNKIDPNGHWIFNLINRPTPMLSWGNMIYMTSVNYNVTGNALIYAPKRTMGTRSLLVPIAYNNVQIQPNKKGYEQLERSGVIESFKIPVDNKGTFEEYKTDNVIYLFEPDGINLYNVKSKLDSLGYPLSNLMKQYEKRNVLLKNMFSLGMITIENKDGISALPVDSDDIQAMRDDIKARHKNEIIITDKPLKWNPMSFPTKDLMLFEEMTADKVAIIDAYGLNQNMFGSAMDKGSTFSNVEGGERQAYNSTILPETEFLYDEMTVQMGLDKENLFLKPDFSHISVLQKDESQHASAFKTRAEAVEKIRTMIELTEEEIRSLTQI